jgi:hypothetical protein
MQRLSTLAFLITLAIFATMFMFLMALIVYVLGPSAKIFVFAFCIPAASVMALFGLILLTLALADAIHFYTMKWRYRERHYQTHYRARRDQR